MADGELILGTTLEQGIDEGVLVEIFKNRWQELSEGKPIVATSPVYEAYSLAAIQEMWNDYLGWRRDVMPTLPEAVPIFSTRMDSETIWVVEDDAAFMILFALDY